MWDDDDDLSMQNAGVTGSVRDSGTAVKEPLGAKTAIIPPFSPNIYSLRETDDIPPDATDRVLMETARTVLGIETLLESKVSALSSAVQHLAETEVAMATEMRDRLGEGASRLEANHAALVKAQDALMDYTAPITELQTVIESLSGLVESLSSIRVSISEAEARLHSNSQDGRKTLLSTGKIQHDAALQRINASAKETQEAVEVVRKTFASGSSSLQAALDKNAAQAAQKSDALHIKLSDLTAKLSAAELKFSKQTGEAETKITKQTSEAESKIVSVVKASQTEVKGTLDTTRRSVTDARDILSGIIAGTQKSIVSEIEGRFVAASKSQDASFRPVRTLLIWTLCLLVITLFTVGYTLFLLMTHKA